MQNQRIVLASRPVGIPEAHHFALDTQMLPELREGELRIDNIYLSVDPAQRGYVNEESNYAPPVGIGETMRALAVGRVGASRHPNFSADDYVYGWFGWQQHAICTPAAVLRRVDRRQAPLPAAAGLLGINGLTASLALQNIGQPRDGETLLVSAAAGAVGSVVGQLGRRLGCRCIAVVGSEEKGELCMQRYGYHAYLNYRRPLPEALQALCPQGVDIHFDSVGGEIADLVLRQMRPFGRVIQCGTVSVPSWAPVPSGPRVERELLTRRLRMQGFVIFDHQARFDAVAAELAALMRAGALQYDEDIEEGLEKAPQALVDVYAGRNRGKKLIRISADE